MILAGHQPNFMPYLGFFDKMLQSDIFILVDHIQYEKKGWQNRNRVRTAHGGDGWTWLTVPVYSSGKYKQPIIEVEICNQEEWGKKMWDTIYYAYKKAPCFDEYADYFEYSLTKEKWEKLMDLNIDLIGFLRDALHIEKPLVNSSDYEFKGEKTPLLIEMTEALGCDTYMSGCGPGAKRYVDERMFEAAGLNHVFQEFEHPEYRQVFKPFVPNMAAIDLLFNYGEEAGEILRGEKKWIML